MDNSVEHPEKSMKTTVNADNGGLMPIYKPVCTVLNRKVMKPRLSLFSNPGKTPLKLNNLSLSVIKSTLSTHDDFLPGISPTLGIYRGERDKINTNFINKSMRKRVTFWSKLATLLTLLIGFHGGGPYMRRSPPMTTLRTGNTLSGRHTLRRGDTTLHRVIPFSTILRTVR